jgi:hypothetical protein
MATYPGFTEMHFDMEGILQIPPVTLLSICLTRDPTVE